MNKKKSSQSTSAAVSLKEMAGILASEMTSTIEDDLCSILSRRTEGNGAVVDAAVDGYLLALSRIIETDAAWNCVVVVFKRFDIEVPSKYYELFGKDT